MTYIFNLSIQKCVFPEIWKCAKITSLYKRGAKEEVENYRPISVLSCVSKVIERHVHDCLYQFLDNHVLLFAGQSGFRPRRSCVTAFTHLIDNWLSAIDEESMIRVVFIDLSKAFDSVNHSILVHKLASYHCLSLTVDWFKSYLHGRTQTVNINGLMSQKQDITCGVPQGSILGPLLFILFANDLHLRMSECDLNLYADDINLYSVGNTVNDIQTQLFNDMCTVYQIVLVLTSQKQSACCYQLVKNDPMFTVVALM